MLRQALGQTASSGTASEPAGTTEDAARLLDRLGHRFKNTLVLIQATAWQTALGAVDVQDFLKLFDGRLRAIAAASDVLARNGWGSFPLGELVRAVLEEHEETTRSRIRIEIGDLPPLLPEAAQNLALALHELTTNALEHGALSVPGGSVRLESRIEGEELVVVWREADGPRVVPPTRQGFGLVLLDRVVARRYAGRAIMDWERSGLICTLRIPGSRILDRPAGRPATS
ncbi:sensor histidine kinase [Benzoatithermus flavus]|uniref:histidine kinase n=1 Tax=Benzoatithermus flavus TaxID=3108223 RepID=A0ABU8XL20_9PROT